MMKDTFRVIGVMSGTSLDGIDLVYAQFSFQNKWTFKINAFETVSYEDIWVDRLSHLVELSMAELKEIDKAYTHYLAEIINAFINKYGIREVNAICSHGHTALHKPEEQLTYQIGNLPILANLLNHQVVCDFRTQDVQLGGQGAPLVPIGDMHLFGDFEFCLNLGGFANMSTQTKDDRIAYDICPVNIVLNHYARQAGLAYDNNGEMARSGMLNLRLLEALNALEFYGKPYPKSLGLEWVKANIFPLIDTFKMDIKDIMHTFCEHIAVQISNQINSRKKASALVTGGGAYNSYLIERLEHYSEHNIIIPEPEIVEFKEALIFAFLGVLKLGGDINCLKSVTGASKNHSSGIVYQP